MTHLPNGYYLFKAPPGAKLASKKVFDDFIMNKVFVDLNNQESEELYDLHEPFLKPRRDGYFRRGDNKGLWNFYYKSGQLFTTGRFKDQKKQGFWEHYYENGQLISSGFYTEGKEIGEWKFYHQNGNPYINVSFVSGSTDGYGELYHENGQIACKGRFILNNPEGVWEGFDEDGFLPERIVYENGIEVEHEVFEPSEDGLPPIENNSEEQEDSSSTVPELGQS